MRFGCWITCAIVALTLAATSGCGTTKQQVATEQLLASDAVDRSISRVDFSPISGRTVYLDTKYIQQIKGLGFVNSEYIISALRQQLFAHRCLLQDSLDQADVVVEARVGTLGNDGHEINYGLPSGNGSLSRTATAVGGSAPLALLPEISLARRDQQVGAAKLAVFAYERESKEPLWQSGTSVAFSNARQTWVFGAGPFQSGTIYESPRLAGARLSFPRPFRRNEAAAADPWLQAFKDKRRFSPEGIGESTPETVADQAADGQAAQAAFEEPAAPEAAETGAAAPAPPAKPPAPPTAPPAEGGAAARLPSGPTK